MAFNPNSLNETTIKRFVDKLVQQNKHKDTWPPKRAAVQEDLAVMFGYKNWHELSKCVKEAVKTSAPMKPNPALIYFPQGQLGHYPKDHTEDPFFVTTTKGYMPESVVFNHATQHSTIIGRDKARRDYFNKLVALNPHAQVLVLQGHNALPFASHADFPFFDYVSGSYESKDDTTVLHQGFLNPDVCVAMGLWIAQSVASNQYGSAISSYVNFVLRTVADNGVLSPSSGFTQKEQKNVILSFFSSLPKNYIANIPGLSTDDTSLLEFLDNADLVAKVYEMLIKRIYCLEKRSIEQAITTPAHSVGFRIPDYIPAHHNVDPLMVFCNIWIRANQKPKIIVVDGLEHDSSLYYDVRNHLSRWGENNTAVFLGANSTANFPNAPKSFERLLAHFGLGAEVR